MTKTLMTVGLFLMRMPLGLIAIYAIGHVYVELICTFLSDHDPMYIIVLVIITMFIVGFILAIIGRLI